MKLVSELRRRNVFRMVVLYVVAAWLIMQVVEVVKDLASLPDWIGPTTLILLAVGFPIALVFSWFYEITSDGISLEKDVDSVESITHVTGRRIDFIVISLLCAAVILFGYDKWWTAPPSGRSIAVLPFVNMSGDDNNEYFSDGISEEILNLLAKTSALRVTSRSSAFTFKGQNIDVPTIAAKLNVAHILEGSVRKSGNQIRVTAQLIEVSTDTHLWSETYDEELKNVFAIQDQIAAAVVKKLKVILLDETSASIDINPEAYDLYLQARYVGAKGSTEAYEQAGVLYRQALAIEPNYTAAWAGMAQNYNGRAARGLMPWDEGFSLARNAANEAMAIDKNSAAAHVALGYIAEQHDNNLTVAAKHYERALALEPTDSDIIFRAATFVQNLGRQDDSIALREYLVSVDPVRSQSHYNLGYSYLSARRWDDAIASFGVALRLNPDSLAAHYLTGIAILMKGESRSGLEEMRLESFEPLRMIGLVVANFAVGQVSRSNSLIEEVTDKYPDWAYNFSHMHAFRNENDRAFDWLEKAIELRDPGVSEIVGEVMLTNLHDDPRWLPLLDSIGKSRSQLDAVRFRVSIPNRGE